MGVFKLNYAAVSEDTARRAKTMNSFYDYNEGSATWTQAHYLDALVSYAEGLVEKSGCTDPAKIEKAQEILDRYSRKIAEAIDKENEIRARVPSVLIAGTSNFPVRKKEKQNEAHRAHHEKTKDLYHKDTRNPYYKKINSLFTESGIIKSDDPEAVDKIKKKIEALQNAADPYGNNAAEIRRLKQRIFELSPDEMKAGKQITVNGEEATFASIVSIFDKYKPDQIGDALYLQIPLIFSDGSRKYSAFLDIQTNEEATQIYRYPNGWEPLTDLLKFRLLISKVAGSGNKAVIFSILKDLDPETQEKKRQKAEQEERGEAQKEIVLINGESAKVIRNTEQSRLQLIFDGKPGEEARATLKSNGFRWAPSQGAWQRLLNENALRTLSRISK